METPRWWGVCNERGFLIGGDGNLIAFRLQSMAEAQAAFSPECYAKEFPQNEQERTPTTLEDIDNRLYEILQYLKERDR